jgi:hypothetical protein
MSDKRYMKTFFIDEADLPEFIKRFRSFTLDAPPPNETLSQEFAAQLLTQLLLQKFRLGKI